MIAPMTFVGYLVEEPDYAPPRRGWIYHLPPLFHAIADARKAREGFQAMAPNDPKQNFKVTITFEPIEVTS